MKSTPMLKKCCAIVVAVFFGGAFLASTASADTVYNFNGFHESADEPSISASQAHVPDGAKSLDTFYGYSSANTDDYLAFFGVTKGSKTVVTAEQWKNWQDNFQSFNAGLEVRVSVPGFFALGGGLNYVFPKIQMKRPRISRFG